MEGNYHKCLTGAYVLRFVLAALPVSMCETLEFVLSPKSHTYAKACCEISKFYVEV